MPEKTQANTPGDFAKAKDLKVIVKFERDETHEGVLRSNLAKEIICQLILLGQKQGRPSTEEENLSEAA